jgi:YVTN family beta-propeller protein
MFSSAVGANPTIMDLDVMVSAPSPDAVSMQQIDIEIPTGQEGMGWISTARELPAPGFDHKIPWDVSVDASTITITPHPHTHDQEQRSGEIDAPIVFKLAGIQINETPGAVPITITEFPVSGPATIVDSHTYQLEKQPSDTLAMNFTVSPAVLTDLDQQVTLTWDCSLQGQACSFGLRAEHDSGHASVATSTAAASAPLRSCVRDDSCYDWHDGKTGVLYGPVNQPTTFWLDVVQTNPLGQKVRVKTLEARAELNLPSFASSSLTSSPSRRLAWLHWLATDAGYCTVQLDNTIVDDHAPTDTYSDGYLVALSGTTGAQEPLVTAYTPAGTAPKMQSFGQVQLRPPATIPTGKGPRSIVTSFGTSLGGSRSQAGLALVTGYWDGSVTAIDLATKTVKATVLDVWEQPESVAVAPDGQTVWLTNPRRGLIQVIDVATLSVRPHPIFLPEPSCVAVARGTGSGGPLALATCAQTGQVTVIRVDTSEIEPTTIAVGRGAYGIAVTPDGARALVTQPATNDVVIVNIANRAVEAGPIPVGAGPEQIAITPDGTRALTVNVGANSVSIVDLETRKVEATMPTGQQPYALAITADSRTAMVANYASGTVTVIDIARHAASTMSAGTCPAAVAFAPDGKTLLVASADTNRLLLI